MRPSDREKSIPVVLGLVESDNATCEWVSTRESRSSRYTSSVAMVRSKVKYIYYI